MVTTKRDVDDRELREDEEEETSKADTDLDEFFFDEDEPAPGERRRDPLRKL